MSRAGPCFVSQPAHTFLGLYFLSYPEVPGIFLEPVLKSEAFACKTILSLWKSTAVFIEQSVILCWLCFIIHRHINPCWMSPGLSQTFRKKQKNRKYKWILSSPLEEETESHICFQNIYELVKKRPHQRVRLFSFHSPRLRHFCFSIFFSHFLWNSSRFQDLLLLLLQMHSAFHIQGFSHDHEGKEMKMHPSHWFPGRTISEVQAAKAGFQDSFCQDVAAATNPLVVRWNKARKDTLVWAWWELSRKAPAPQRL